MTVVEYSEKGDRNFQLDRVISISKNGVNLLAVLDGVGDSECGFVEEFEEKIKLNFDIIFENISSNVSSQLWSLIKKTAGECNCNGKICAVFSLITKERLVVAHCGDCRAYLPDRNIKTADHSLACEHAGINQDHLYIARHPLRNRVAGTISRSKQFLEVSSFPPLLEDERIVLCSDGWWRNIEINDILGVTEKGLKGTVVSAVESPIVEEDNVTVILFSKKGSEVGGINSSRSSVTSA